MSLGFSVYFGLDNTKEKNIELLKKAHSLGFTRVFTSLHIPEANYDVLKQEVNDFYKLAKEYNMDIISDISPNTFKFLDLSEMDMEGLHNMGVKTARIDFGFTEKEISDMSKNSFGIKIQLNASTITKEFFIKLDSFNPNYSNVDSLHNFYPRIGTGISEECMIEKNQILKDRGISSSAFVQSNFGKRSPLKDGLPTLEEHRGSEVTKAANHLKALGNQSIFIGDSDPSFEELRDLANLRKGAVEIRIKLKIELDTISKKLLKHTYSSRTDDARDAIRAFESRNVLNGETIIPTNTIERKTFDITIDNSKYERYMGELQILKRDLEKDERINVVAEVLPDDYYLLKYLKNGMKFYFKIV